MTSNYDVLRRTDDDLSEDSIRELRPARMAVEAGADLDEAETAESFELPGADLSSEVLWTQVIPRRPDEFTCSRCFLVYHRSRLASGVDGSSICVDCAG